MKSLVFLIFVFGVALCDSYSAARAREMIFMSAVTYNSADSINAWSCPECSAYHVAHQKAFVTKSNQGFLAFSKNQNAIIIAFRGSSNINNWLTNLNTIQTNYPGCTGCSVHQGFYSAYKDELSSVVRPLLEQLLSLYRDAKIMITGHSLGGALAVLCALEVKDIHGRVDELYAMGQPRVGNANFAAHLQARIPNTFRVINYADIVVHNPPSSFSFKHGGHEVWYTNNMQTHVICVSEDPNCANSVPVYKFNTGDHSLSNYQNIKTSMSMLQKMLTYFKSETEYRNEEVVLDEEFLQNQLNGVSNYIQILKLQEASRFQKE